MKSFICRGCSNPVISTGHTSVDIGASANLEVVDKFSYLGDMLSVDGDADAAVAAIFWLSIYGCTLAPPSESEWTVRVWRRWGLMSNYFDHLQCCLTHGEFSTKPHEQNTDWPCSKYKWHHNNIVIFTKISIYVPNYISYKTYILDLSHFKKMIEWRRFVTCIWNDTKR